MRAARRRRLDRVLLVAGAGIAGGLATFGAVIGRPEHIVSMWTLAEIDSNRDATITEVIDYDFGAAVDRHGIYRDVPGLAADAEVEVSAEGAPDEVELLQERPFETRIRIGDPNETVSGQHRYRIRYDLPQDDSGISGLWDIVDRFGWNAVGSEWTVPIDQAEVHVVAPWEWVDVSCSTGAAGSFGTCAVEQPEPGHLVVRVDDLDAFEGISVFADDGSSIETAPAPPQLPEPVEAERGAGLLLPALAAGGAALLAGLLNAFAVRRTGREQVASGGPADAAFAGAVVGELRHVDLSELTEMATIEFAPPPGVPPWQGGLVLAETVQDDHKVSWLIGAAVDGYVELDDSNGTTTIRRGQRSGGETSRLLDMAFDGRHEIELGSYDKDFASAWSEVARRMDEWRDSSTLWDRGGDRRSTWAKVLGVLTALAGLALGWVGGAISAEGGDVWLLPTIAGGVLAGMGMAAALCAWELRIRTPVGSAAWLRVESFRRFLAESEAHHAREAADRGVLREYTAWAVAVGEIDRWSHAVSAAAISDVATTRLVYLAPSLSSATASAARAPSSSSGGGFSGGVGGGGGGGGGGSW